MDKDGFSESKSWNKIIQIDQERSGWNECCLIAVYKGENKTRKTPLSYDPKIMLLIFTKPTFEAATELHVFFSIFSCFSDLEL